MLRINEIQLRYDAFILTPLARPAFGLNIIVWNLCRRHVEGTTKDARRTPPGAFCNGEELAEDAEEIAALLASRTPPTAALAPFPRKILPELRVLT
jgi:hypothetical protein